MKAITLNEAARLLKENDNYLILCHRSPDGDTIGSAFALAMALDQLGKRSCIDCTDEFPKKYGYMTEIADRSKKFEPEFIVAVDVADQSMLGDRYRDTIPDLVVDHHISNTSYGKQNYVFDSAANCENIFKLINELGVEIDKDIANALYTGIATDTGCFKFSNTTATTHIIAADLIEKGADIENINRIMFETKSIGRVKIERYVYENIKTFSDDRGAFVAIPQSACIEAGATPDELEGITSLPRQIEGVIIGITLREQKDGALRVSVRTHAPLDASEFCAMFGGGGHARAAGCAFETTLEDAEKKIVWACAKALGNQI